MLFKFGLDFYKHFVCLGFFIIFWFFFKVNSGVFLHNRVATLVPNCQHRCGSVANASMSAV